MLSAGSSARSRHSVRSSILWTHSGCREYLHYCTTGQLSVYVEKNGRIAFQCRIESLWGTNSAQSSFAVGLGYQLPSLFVYLFAIRQCPHS